MKKTKTIRIGGHTSRWEELCERVTHPLEKVYNVNPFSFTHGDVYVEGITLPAGEGQHITVHSYVVKTISGEPSGAIVRLLFSPDEHMEEYFLLSGDDVVPVRERIVENVRMYEASIADQYADEDEEYLAEDTALRNPEEDERA